LHIGRGLYYGSYLAPRVLVWSIGVIILVLMMAMMWPNWKYYDLNTINSAVFTLAFDQLLPFISQEQRSRAKVTGLSSAVLPINKARTKAINRVGPHNKEILDILISGMLGDFWADKIPGKALSSVRFNIEQSISNTAYIHYLSLLFYNLGYCSRPVPTLIVKSPAALGDFNLTSSPACIKQAGLHKETAFAQWASGVARGKGGQIQTEWKSRVEKRFNYKLTLFTFSSFTWIYDSFYITVNGKTIKTVPVYISDYLTPLGLAHLVMQTGVKENEVLTLSLSPAYLRKPGLHPCLCHCHGNEPNKGTSKASNDETNFINISEFNLIKEALLNKYNIESDIMLNSPACSAYSMPAGHSSL
jgi:hypothetical protein